MTGSCGRRNAGALVVTAILAVGVTVLGGCATRPEGLAKLDNPVVEIMTVDIQGRQVVGVRLLKPDGVSFCGAYRADHGLVVCSHFDLQGLEEDGVPAAMAQNWKVNGLKGELDAKIKKVNSLAAAKGISVGMTVREALGHLIDKSAPTTSPGVLFAPETADTSPAWYYFDWMASARYAPVFHVRDTESSLGPYATKTKMITMKDLVKMHGHPCDGVETAACAMSVGLKTLYPDGVIDRTDTGCITNNSPCYGDVAAYLTGGRIRFGTQKIDPSLGNEFILQRFSTEETVKVSLKPGVFPSEVLALEQKIRAGTFTLEEMRRCQRIEWDYARRLLNTPPDECFEVVVMKGFRWTPDVYEHRDARGDTVNKDCLRATSRQADKKPVQSGPLEQE